jgi:hypothetical protein
MFSWKLASPARAVEEGRKVVPHVGPDLAEGTAERLRMAAADDRDAGVVVEIGQLLAPGDEHGEARGEHHVHGRSQGRRPGIEGAEREIVPPKAGDQRRGFAADGRQGLHGGLRDARSRVQRLWAIVHGA